MPKLLDIKHLYTAADAQQYQAAQQALQAAEHDIAQLKEQERAELQTIAADTIALFNSNKKYFAQIQHDFFRGQPYTFGDALSAFATLDKNTATINLLLDTMNDLLRRSASQQCRVIWDLETIGAEEVAAFKASRDYIALENDSAALQQRLAPIVERLATHQNKIVQLNEELLKLTPKTVALENAVKVFHTSFAEIHKKANVEYQNNRSSRDDSKWLPAWRIRDLYTNYESDKDITRLEAYVKENTGAWRDKLATLLREHKQLLGQIDTASFEVEHKDNPVAQVEHVAQDEQVTKQQYIAKINAQIKKLEEKNQLFLQKAVTNTKFKAPAQAITNILCALTRWTAEYQAHAESSPKQLQQKINALLAPHGTDNKDIEALRKDVAILRTHRHVGSRMIQAVMDFLVSIVSFGCVTRSNLFKTHSMQQLDTMQSTIAKGPQ